jgi:hypothetical protein
MGSEDFNYLNPEDRRRSNEPELFAQVSVALEQRSKLSSLESRGTLAIALKVAGHLTRDVGAVELLQTVQGVLPGELKARGVKDAVEVCAAIESMLRKA